MSWNENGSGSGSSYDIYVSNVPKTLSEVELRKLFTKYGEIKHVLCRWKDPNYLFGYGIVKFVYKQDADRVLKNADEVYWNGNIMPVKAAHGKKDSVLNEGVLIPKPRHLLQNNQNKRIDFFTDLPVPMDFGRPYKQPNLDDRNGAMLEVICTNVENNVTFHGCLVHRFEDLAHLSRDLNNFAMQNWKSLNCQPKKVLKDRVYAALFSMDHTWYRCVVVQDLPKTPQMCVVQYIDYGNKENIPRNSIIEIPPPLQYPQPFASKFYLYNLEPAPIPGGTKSYLHKLTNKRMSLCAIKSSIKPEYQVLKCTCDGADVIAESIRKGSAKTQSFSPPKQSREKTKTTHNSLEVSIKASSSKAALSSPSKSNQNKKAKEKDVPKTNNQCNGYDELANRETDFHPKTIIKRGSKLSEILGHAESMKIHGSADYSNFRDSKHKNSPKNAKQQHSLSIMDNVIGNLKLINNIRGLVSQSADDSVITQAVDLLKTEVTTTEPTEASLNNVATALDKYSESLEKITKCLNKGDLPDLKANRDLCRTSLIIALKYYLDNFDKAILERKEKIQQTIIDLESNSNAWMNLQLEKRPATIEELVTEYDKIKAERWKSVCESREQTNEKHKSVMDLVEQLQKRLYLNTSGEADHNSSDLGCFEKSSSFFDKWDNALQVLGKAIDSEMHMLTLSKDKNQFSVIQCLLDGLDIHKEKIDSVCDLYQTRVALYDELCALVPLETSLLHLANYQDEIQNISSNIEQYKILSVEKSAKDLNADLSPILKELHSVILKKNVLMEKLTKESESSFPELNIEHPELQLSENSTHQFIKNDWKEEHFQFEEIERGNLVYSSKLLDESVVIKEYSYQSEEEKNTLLKKCLEWNKINHEAVFNVKAAFNKDDKTVCFVMPTVANTLLHSSPLPTPSEGVKACSILKQVVYALQELHAKDTTHGALHPNNILIDQEKIYLDLCLDLANLGDDVCLKGINFKSPSNSQSAADDMYGFGCLVLWVLFRNLSFTSANEGVPNITAYRSIIDEMMGRDYNILCNLLSPEPAMRPTASNLVTKKFLEKYENFCTSRIESGQSS